jgi:hypothetical protein
MSETQGKGRGEGAVEKNTSRPNEQGGSSGGTRSAGSSQKAADKVHKGRAQTRNDIRKTLGK